MFIAKFCDKMIVSAVYYARSISSISHTTLSRKSTLNRYYTIRQSLFLRNAIDYIFIFSIQLGCELSLQRVEEHIVEVYSHADNSFYRSVMCRLDKANYPGHDYVDQFSQPLICYVSCYSLVLHAPSKCDVWLILMEFAVLPLSHASCDGQT